MKDITCILFDLDGTLYLQKPLRQYMMRLLLQHCLIHPIDGYGHIKIISTYRNAQEAMREEKPTSPSLAERQLQHAARQCNRPIEHVAATIRYWMEEKPLSYLPRLIPEGLHEFLGNAQKRGIKLGVVSDYPAAAKLEAMDLHRYFDVLVSAQDESVQSFKPNPAGLKFAMDQLQVPQDCTVYIGDRPEIDGEVASRAGIRFLLFDPRKKYSQDRDIEKFRSYKDLVSLLFDS